MRNSSKGQLFHASIQISTYTDHSVSKLQKIMRCMGVGRLSSRFGLFSTTEPWHHHPHEHHSEDNATQDLKSRLSLLRLLVVTCRLGGLLHYKIVYWGNFNAWKHVVEAIQFWKTEERYIGTQNVTTVLHKVFHLFKTH